MYWRFVWSKDSLELKAGPSLRPVVGEPMACVPWWVCTALYQHASEVAQAAEHRIPVMLYKLKLLYSVLIVVLALLIDNYLGWGLKLGPLASKSFAMFF